MEFELARYWWVLALRGVLAIIFGVLAFFFPLWAFMVVVYLFAAYAFVDGVIALVAAVGGRDRAGPWWALLLEGVAGIAFGVVTFAWPLAAVIVEFVLVYLIAYWLIATGVFEVIAAIRLWRYVRGEWALALAGALSIILGVAIAVMPEPGLIVVAWWIAAYAVAFGILLLIVAFRIRNYAGHITVRGFVHGTAIPT